MKHSSSVEHHALKSTLNFTFHMTSFTFAEGLGAIVLTVISLAFRLNIV